MTTNIANKNLKIRKKECKRLQRKKDLQKYPHIFQIFAKQKCPGCFHMFFFVSGKNSGKFHLYVENIFANSLNNAAACGKNSMWKKSLS